VAEDCGRHDHLRVVTALENFEVGAAGQRSFNLNSHLARFQRRGSDIFDAHLLSAVEDSGFHGRSVWLRPGKAEEPFSGPRRRKRLAGREEA
jgi:hypothetical protein